LVDKALKKNVNCVEDAVKNQWETLSEVVA